MDKGKGDTKKAGQEMAKMVKIAAEGKARLRSWKLTEVAEGIIQNRRRFGHSHSVVKVQLGLDGGVPASARAWFASAFDGPRHLSTAGGAEHEIPYA